MEYPVLTPLFVKDLLYLSTVVMLTREYYVEFAAYFDTETRPGKILSDIQQLLSKLKDEPIVLSIKPQVEALKLLVKYLDKSDVLITEIIDNVQQATGVNLEEVVEQIRNDQLENTIHDKIVKIHQKVVHRLQYLEIKDDLKELKQLTSGETSTSLDEFLIKVRRIAKKVSSIDVAPGQYEVFDSTNQTTKQKLIQDYKQILDPSQYVKSGYPDLDKRLYGGFAKTRLYVVAGPSGHGKSTYLLNWLCRAVQIEQESMFIYVTLENIVPETLLRIASIITKESVLDKAIQDPDQLDYYLDKAATFLQTKGNRVVIKYFSPTTPVDVIIDDIKHYNNEGNLKAVYYDYLNVMGMFSEDMRRYLGQITRKLKDLAVELQVPVVTAAQLHREAYKAVNPSDVGVHNMAESMLIVENADVILLTTPDQQPGHAFLQIKKRRYAREGLLRVKYNPDAYLVENIYEYNMTFNSAPNTTSTNPSPFH